MTPEAKVKKKVRDLLKRHNAYYATPATGGYGVSGTPDFLACLYGQFLGIECKANGNTLTALQQAALAAIQKAGGVGMVVDETNLQNLAKVLERIEKGRMHG